MTNTLRDILTWDGSSTQILLYAFFRPFQEAETIDLTYKYTAPLSKTKPYYLDDCGEFLCDAKLYLYEIKIEEYPSDIDEYLRFCFKKLIKMGALGAFYMFEGSFHYVNLFSKNDFYVIYGLATSTAIFIELDMQKLSNESWLNQVEKFKSYLVDENVVSLLKPDWVSENEG